MDRLHRRSDSRDYYRTGNGLQNDLGLGMEIQQMYFTIGIITSVLSTVLTIGMLFWRLGQFQGKVDAIGTKINGLEGWIKDLAQGNAPMCARHDQRLVETERRLANLESHGRRLDSDEKRLTQLEDTDKRQNEHC